MSDRAFANLVAAAVALVASTGVLAQAQAGDGAGTRSPLAGTWSKLEEALAQKVIGADDAASRWISGRLSSLEPAAQTRDFAAALARDPKEPLFVASLADACARPPSPIPPECTERDIIGYWASRDAENAVPWLLQADRARRRNNVASLVENLDRASRARRYDDYSGHAGAVLWSRLSTIAAPSERPAAAVLAMSMPNAGGAPLKALELVCGSTARTLEPRIAPACARLGGSMAERAANLNDRRAGAQIGLSAATTDSARAIANETARSVVVAQDRCREAIGMLERLAAGDAGARDRATMLAERYIAQRAKEGEAPACAALAGALSIR
jgi:hypothetical protein